MSELERAIDDLARLGGERSWSFLASTDPAEFMRQVAAAIRDERARIAALEAQCAAMREALRAAQRLLTNTSTFDFDHQAVPAGWMRTRMLVVARIDTVLAAVQMAPPSAPGGER